MSGSDGNTVERTYTQRIETTPERVFPLLCPVRETEWLDGWTYEMIHSKSGFAEEGCVFRTPASEHLPETVWLVTRHSQEDGVVEFVRVTPGLLTTRLRIDLAPATDGTTSVHIRYTHTPTSAAGAELIAASWTPEQFQRLMQWWERSMNHFLNTGRMLRRA